MILNIILNKKYLYMEDFIKKWLIPSICKYLKSQIYKNKSLLINYNKDNLYRDLIEASKTYRKALDELNIGESQSNAIEQETNNQEFSPLLKGITGFDTPTEYTSAKVQSSEVYLRSKGSHPDKADKGIDR